MGQHAIVEKLWGELKQEITTERQVVYILAETRKYLEITDKRDALFALYFYCCWALHTRMKREGAARILQRFDEALEYAVENRATALNELPPKIREDLQNTMGYVKFLEQLQEFIRSEDLPGILLSDPYRWATFLSLYTEVIEECPLELAEQGIKLKYVKGVVVKKLRKAPLESTGDGIVLFGAEWGVRTADPNDSGMWTVYFTLDKAHLIPRLGESEYRSPRPANPPCSAESSPPPAPPQKPGIPSHS
jgi:hypothetical protein